MRDGYTPLHVAAKEGHVEICELLLDKGASVSLTTKVYSTVPKMILAQNSS